MRIGSGGWLAPHPYPALPQMEGLLLVRDPGLTAGRGMADASQPARILGTPACAVAS